MTRSLFDAYVPPEDGYAGTWIGRAWVPGALAGPSRGAGPAGRRLST